VIGGIFGALVGNGLSSRHDGGFGTLAGAAVGAVGGAAIGGSTANQTSPGCAGLCRAVGRGALQL
jgi:hypothetical protein